MFSSIRSLTRLRPHSSYIFKRSININVTITRPIIHTWSRYQSTTTESIIVPDTNDPSSSSTSSSSTTTTSTSEPTITDSTPELTSDPAAEAATTTSTLEENSVAMESAPETPTESATTIESTTPESTSTSTSTTTTKTRRPKVERSKIIHIPFKSTLAWFEHKIQTFGNVKNSMNISTPEGLRILIQYENWDSAYRAAKFFSGRQYKVGELTMHLAEDRPKPLEHVPMIPSKEIGDRRRVELTIPLTDPIKQHLKQFGNVEVYGLIQRFSAFAVFETEDAAQTAISNTPNRYRYQTGIVQVNAPILKDPGYKSELRRSRTTGTGTGTARTKNKSQSQANVASKSSKQSAWNETIDPASGHTYYWHSETRQVTWDRPAEMGPKQ